ncbi:MAG: EAL domain-containing protein [Massilia sp.]
MYAPPVSDFASSSGAVCDAVLRLRGDALADELGRVARALLGSPYGVFVATGGAAPQGTAELFVDGAQSLCQDVVFEGQPFGQYAVAGRVSYGEAERRNLAALAALTANLLQVHSLAQRSTNAFAKVEARLAQQSQVLDQIQESVLTMDLTGYITSWNQGAEAMFGYSALEAIGNNFQFLHAEDDHDFHDPFLAQGGRKREVRRRKKSGDVFWASMSFSPLRDLAERQVGVIAYLSDITERKQAEERLYHLAYYDALTGLPNRTLFNKLVDQALSMAQRNDGRGAVLFVDLNRFKLINDALGRPIGDTLLEQVALRFKRSLRDEDIVARLNGDEFAVGLFDIRQHFEATTVAQKLQAALTAPFEIDGHTLSVGASIGISVFPQDAGDSETLLRLADIAMVRAKEGPARDDSVAFYSRDMNIGMQRRMRVESGLRHALGHGELLLHYQPKFEIGSARLIGAEALVRWVHPERGLVPPGEFIPLAETTGLILQVGEWVLEAACAQAAIWQHAGLLPFRVAVNVSAREFTSALPGRLASTLGRYRLDPSWLELEITESTLMNEIENVIGIMDEIHKLGVALSLDDFGTGYSSLSYLKRFPIDTLKIDRSFTTGLPDDASDCAIAATIISIGQQLHHKVIAEGVETVEQYEFLRSAGCDEVQGYLFSQPVPADQFEASLRDNWLLIS